MNTSDPVWAATRSGKSLQWLIDPSPSCSITIGGREEIRAGMRRASRCFPSTTCHSKKSFLMLLMNTLGDRCDAGGLVHYSSEFICVGSYGHRCRPGHDGSLAF